MKRWTLSLRSGKVLAHIIKVGERFELEDACTEGVAKDVRRLLEGFAYCGGETGNRHVERVSQERPDYLAQLIYYVERMQLRLIPEEGE